MINAISELWFARAKDSPAKAWWGASLDRAPVFRALRIGPNDAGAVYAAAPFRVARDANDQWCVLAAWPSPALLGDPDPDWLGIETVLAWNPLANSVQILGDTMSQLVGAFERSDQGTLFGQPFAFFRTWVEQRAAFATAWQAARSAHFTTPPPEKDTPGMLIVGDAQKVLWRGHDLPETLNCVGIDAATVNKAIVRSANLPRAVSAMRAAA
ncbi:MAG: hypothetical protein KGM49_00500 [Sphingomonadales bacterium]|nr:hypothetical protein [Sphingomonadales bacterium]